MAYLLIIGSAGRMGKWFLEYLIKMKKQKTSSPIINSIEKINIYDIKKIDFLDKQKYKGVSIVTDLVDTIPKSNIILFCTPTEESIRLLKKYNNLLKSGTLIIEISSIKFRIYEILKKNASEKKNIMVLCIHPMFGPGASFFSKKNKIIYIPVNNHKIKEEEEIVNQLFPKYEKIIIDNPKDHDLSISVIISLIYFINLIFSRLLLETSYDNKLKLNMNPIKFFKKISGSSYKIQSLLSESILVDDVNLFMTLFVNNRQAINIIKNYGEIYSNILGKLQNNDNDFLREFILDTRKKINKQIDIEKSYKHLYQLLEKYDRNNSE